MKTSVYIPSIPKSFENVSNIIDVYLNGTVKPDEIVINLTMFKNVASDIIQIFKNKYYNKAELVLTEEQLFAGPNRQQAKYLCNGDIIIYQDDDDLPHKRRIEIIKNCFEKYDIVALNHSYVNINSKEPIVDLSFEQLNSQYLFDLYFPNKELSDGNKINCYGSKINFPVHAGTVSIKKEILDKIYWRTNKNSLYNKLGSTNIAEDFDFCMEVLYTYNKSMIINSPIYYYNNR